MKTSCKVNGLTEQGKCLAARLKELRETQSSLNEGNEETIEIPWYARYMDSNAGKVL